MANPFRFLEFFVIIVCLILGPYLLVEPHSFGLEPKTQLVFGIVLVIYGLFRLFRVIVKYKRTNE